MHINKQSWHYKWYQWTYSVFGDEYDIPYSRTNLCQYCQRIFWSTVGFPIYLSWWLLCSILYYVIMTPIALFFGFLPKNIYSQRFRHDLRYNPEFFSEYDGLWGWVYPWSASGIGLVCGLVCLLEYLSWTSPVSRPWAILFHAAVGLVVASLIAYSWITDDNETANLVRAWTSAKKSRFCPIVEFTDEPTSTNVNEE